MNKRYFNTNLKTLFIFLFLLLPSISLGKPAMPLDCSSNAGNVVINEVQTNDNFLEFYIPTGENDIDISILDVYVNGKKKFSLGAGSCTINETTTLDSSNNSTWSAGTYIVCSYNSNNAKAEILLSNQTPSSNADAVMDYFLYGNIQNTKYSIQDSSCTSIYTAHSSNENDIARLPNGTGTFIDNSMGSTPGSENILYTPPATINHYSIDVTTPGVTCEESEVTITAHDINHLPVNPTAGTSLSLGTSIAVDGWRLSAGGGTFNSGTNTYDFSGTESFVKFFLKQGTASTVNINVIDNNLISENAAEDINVQFEDTAFIFSETINTQISGKPSNIAPDNQSLELRAVKTNDKTKACEAALVGTTAIDFAYECNNPTSCYASNLVSVGSTVIQRNNNANVNNFTPVNMTFDANGVASFVFNYKDAGQIKLHAKKPDISLYGSSNSFVVRPFGFYMSNLNTAADATGAVFAKAGDDFAISLTAKIWGSDQDTNTDGIPDNHDNLIGNNTTFNFGKESSAQTLSLSHTKRYPLNASSSNGVLSGDTSLISGGVSSQFNNGVAANINLKWSEVGIIDISASLNNYLLSSKNINSTKNNVGRFIPYSLSIISNLPDFIHSCDSFTYLNQPFYYNTAPSITVTAINKQGDTCNNYGGGSSGADGFWKLNSLLNRSFAEGHTVSPSASLTVSSVGSITLTGESDFDGMGQISQEAGVTGDEFKYTKNNIETPFNADVDVTYLSSTLTDTDGACYDPDANGTCDNYEFTISEATTIFPNELRYGRMVMNDVYGSELHSIKVPVNMEYWQQMPDGNKTFILNSDDNCTVLTDTDVTFSDYSDNLDSGETSVLSISQLNGKGYLQLSAPGDGNDGNVCVGYDLYGSGSGNIQDWLEDNWQCISTTSTTPMAKIRFGIYSGNNRQIYMREIY